MGLWRDGVVDVVEEGSVLIVEHAGEEGAPIEDVVVELAPATA